VSLNVHIEALRLLTGQGQRNSVLTTARFTKKPEHENEVTDAMSYSLPSVNPARVRSFLLRLPLCTRIILILIVAFWVASLSSSFRHWACLAPNEVFNGGGQALPLLRH
jgi:hypothetical protein